MKKSNKNKIVTGGVLAASAISCLVIGAEVMCLTNMPIDSFCPVASCMASVFGYEAGLHHQMKDLERFDGLQMYGEDDSVAKITVQDVMYQEMKDVHYVLPVGYMLTSDENGKPIGIRSYQSDESSEVQYPVAPIIEFDNSDKVIYKWILTNEDETTVNIYNANWSYVDGEFVNHSSVYSTELEMKR